jgi:hypothetical protein
MSGGCSATESILGGNNPLSAAQVSTTNALIDQLGIKDRIEDELYSHVDEISGYTGIPTYLVEQGIETLNIQDWEVVEKPSASEAVETGTYSLDVDGTPVEVTTYEDAGVVTVEAYGQEMTFAVPESAQDYLYLLPMVETLN